jgi:hypothetical protein
VGGETDQYVFLAVFFHVFLPNSLVFGRSPVNDYVLRLELALNTNTAEVFR